MEIILHAFINALPLFISGAKIHQSGGKTRCIERGGVNYTLEESSDIPEPIASYLQHAMEGLRKCKRIESAMTDLEKQSSNGVYFPVIVGQRPRRERRKSSTASERRSSSTSTMYQTSPSVLQLPDNIQVDEFLQKWFINSVLPSIHKARRSHCFFNIPCATLNTMSWQSLCMRLL